MTTEELKQILTCMSDQCNLTLFDKLGNFNLSEEQIIIFTGYSWENIEELRSMLSSMRDSATRTVTQAIIVFLMKLRTGNSSKMIASILQLEYEQLVSHYTLSVIESFQKDVLPCRFGLNVCSRIDLINNNTAPIAEKLYGFNGKLIIICDGTYAYHQKSSNNHYQRKSFSGHKKLPLCKPFTICTTNGYVVDMLGPYEANMNDAAILRHLIQQPNGLCDLMQKDDVFILDRGFRDVKKDLEDKQFKVLMPALKGSGKQLSTKDSNDSRFVTKLRWVVEAVHGMLKSKNNLLGHKVDNKMLPNIGVYYKIAAFLLNQFGKRLNSDIGISSEIVEQMILQKEVNNTLGDLVEEKGWLRKSIPFQCITSADLHDFPELTENELKILFTGTYQYSQAISYLSEMITDNGELNLRFLTEQPNIVKLQVQSRHISRKRYRCFIEYVPHGNSRSGISRYFCECANGRRTVGCCSHIAAVIYYLSYARSLSKIPRPAEQLSEIFKVTDVTPVIADESDED